VCFGRGTARCTAASLKFAAQDHPELVSESCRAFRILAVAFVTLRCAGRGVDFCFWHIADIDVETEHVRSWEVKQTSLIRALASAHDPHRTGCAGSANEERRGADQGTVVDLPHEEVRDIRTADRTEAPIL
jgi:hypothetical protein